MKRKTLGFRKGFRAALDQRHSQAAEMVIGSGAAEGRPQNRHRAAVQWLFVVEGHGIAKINGRGYRLRRGSLILIEPKDQHEIRNTGHALLRTLNVYVPRAYSRSGDELPRAKP